MGPWMHNHGGQEVRMEILASGLKEGKPMKVRLIQTWFIVSLSLSLPGFGNADVVYNNLGTGDSYNCCQGWAIGLPDRTIAFAFTPGANYDLTRIDVGVGWEPEFPPNSMILNLLNDSSGQPGSVIESWTVMNLPPLVGSTNTLESVAPSGLVHLLAGTSYWVQIEPGDTSTLDFWNWNSTGATGPRYGTALGSVFTDTNTVGALRVLGTTSAVPEPGFVVLPAATLLFSVILRGSRKRESANQRLLRSAASPSS